MIENCSLSVIYNMNQQYKHRMLRRDAIASYVSLVSLYKNKKSAGRYFLPSGTLFMICPCYNVNVILQDSFRTRP